jgi:hypothetical protein
MTEKLAIQQAKLVSSEQFEDWKTFWKQYLVSVE